jgi:K+-transporting ATPase c subunit
MDSNSPLMILMMVVTLVCAIIPAATGAMLPLSAFAQQAETSLGEEEEESLAESIVSNVSKGGDEYDDKQIGDAYQWRSNQDSTVSTTVSRNQEQNRNEDVIGGFANDTTHLTAEQNAGNVSVSMALSMDSTTAMEETSTPPPDDAQE